jgi:cysteine desulfurase
MIYLDHAASTPVRPEVRSRMLPWLGEDGGNPSSLHAAGRLARRAVEDARERIAGRLDVSPKEIVFTSGATEANALAILGAAEALRSKGDHAVTTAIEHPCVLEAFARLERTGFAVTRVKPGASGLVEAADIRAALTPRTVLVSVMAVNNETGVIQRLKQIRELLPPGVVLHSDAAQAAGKLALDPAVADLAAFSAHKIHGPKGVGALRVRKGVPLAPLFAGGGQEFERRAGTENVAGIVGFAEALDLACAGRADELRKAGALRERLERGLLAVEGAALNGAPEERLPHIVNVSFEGVDGEAAVLALDAEGVCVSSGSACASGGTEPSHVLLAMGQPKARAKGGIRFSLSPFTREADIDEAVRAARRVVERLRKR